MTRAAPGEPAGPSGVRLERSIARLLTIGTYASIVLLAIGFVLMLLSGISPLDGAPPFDPRSIPADILALQPLGFLWLGLIVVVATPSARVAASLVGYLRQGERRMAIISVAILFVIALSVLLASGSRASVEIGILVVAFVVILLGAELFTNGIEWFGRKLELAEGAVGSVLAAVGTALPETMIPIIAILTGAGSEASHGVGVGAILGAPFMLSTLAMFVTGVAVLYAARKRPRGDDMPVDTKVLAHDMRYFAIAYAIAIGAALLPLDPAWPKWVVAIVLIGIYGWYVKGHFEEDPNVDAEDLPPLRFNRLDPATPNGEGVVPRLRVVNLQVLVALGLIVVGAFFFVDAVEHLSTSLGVDPIILALVIAPIATELPEKFNSVIWVRQGKDTLAMGNITGAMVFQSTIPTVVALVFAADAWHISDDSRLAFLSAGIAFVSSAAIFVPMARSGHLLGRRLLLGGGFYVLYLAIVGLSLAGVV